MHNRTQDLPSEIITGIFIFVCGGDVLIPPTENGYPWILGYVCSRWRNILWSSPSIWKRLIIGHKLFKIPTIPIEGPRNSQIERYSVSDVFAYILQRIAGPISLRIKDERNVENVMSLIVEHLTRFTELSIDRLNQGQLLNLFSAPPSAFSHIQNLELTDFYFDAWPPNMATSPLETSPNLRSVTYLVFSTAYIPQLLLLPWSQIEKITVGFMSVPLDVVLEILQSAPALSSCSFEIGGPKVPIPTTRKLTLPTLSIFKITARESFDLGLLFNSIITPSLKTLSLHTQRISRLQLTSLKPCSSVVELVLTENITSGDISDNDLELLLDHFPSLVRLHFPWVIPPSFFIRISDGALSTLKDVSLRVNKNGFGAFLDMMDLYVTTGREWRFSNFAVECKGNSKIPVLQKYYWAHYEKYEKIAGASMVVTGSRRAFCRMQGR